MEETNQYCDSSQSKHLQMTETIKQCDNWEYSVSSLHNEKASNIDTEKVADLKNETLDSCNDDHDIHNAEKVSVIYEDEKENVSKVSSVVVESNCVDKYDNVPVNLHCYELKVSGPLLESDIRDLGLKCKDEITDSSTSIKKPEGLDASRTDEESSPLEIDKFLKFRQAKFTSVLQVYMLGSVSLSAPVAESLKSPTDDLNFPQNCHQEMTRLMTYTEYPLDCPVFVLKLARNGFVYRPMKKSVDCYACHFSIPVADLYKPGFDPLLMHHQRKPDCLLIQGVGCNEPFPSCDNKADVQPQKMIHCNSVPQFSPKIAVVSPIQNGIDKKDAVVTKNHAFVEHKSYEMQNQVLLSEHKSYTTDSVPSIEQPHTWPQSQQQKVRNEKVNVTLGSHNTGPRAQHCESLPAISETNSSQAVPKRSNSSSSNLSNAVVNPGAQGAGTQQKAVASGTVTDNSNSQPKEKKKLTYSDLGIYAEKPKRADMAVMAKRIQSFQGHWNKKLTQTPDMLAEAGMYYAGYADCARCFFCGGGLKNWEAPDNPWIEHARWFPKCTYLRMCKGPLFVEIVQRKNKEKEDITLKDVEQEIALKLTEKPIANNGNIKSTVITAQSGAQNTLAALKPLSDVSQLEAENEELKSQVTCKICMDEESSVVFLPCGHLVACTHCAIALKNCPLCRSEIKGSVKARLS